MRHPNTLFTLQQDIDISEIEAVIARYPQSLPGVKEALQQLREMAIPYTFSVTVVSTGYCTVFNVVLDTSDAGFVAFTLAGGTFWRYHT